MTLYANSGIRWPKQEKTTQDAGRASLQAASDLFRILAAIEGRQFPISSEGRVLRLTNEKVECAESLQRASATYSTVAEQLSNELVEELSPSEIEMAAVPSHRRYYEDRFIDLFLSRSQISVRQLYLELSHRSARLASAVRALEETRDPADLAPEAFQMMSMWESMALLARVIGVIGRRSPTRRTDADLLRP